MQLNLTNWAFDEPVEMSNNVWSLSYYVQCEKLLRVVYFIGDGGEEGKYQYIKKNAFRLKERCLSINDLPAVWRTLNVHIELFDITTFSC